MSTSKTKRLMTVGNALTQHNGKIFIVTNEVFNIPPCARNRRVQVVVGHSPTESLKGLSMSAVIFTHDVSPEQQELFRKRAHLNFDGTFSKDQIIRVLRLAFDGRKSETATVKTDTKKSPKAAHKRSRRKATGQSHNTKSMLPIPISDLKLYLQELGKDRVSGKCLAGFFRNVMDITDTIEIRRRVRELIRKHFIRPIKGGTARKGWYTLNKELAPVKLKLSREQLNKATRILRETAGKHAPDSDLLKPYYAKRDQWRTEIENLQSELAKLEAWITNAEKELRKLGPAPKL